MRTEAGFTLIEALAGGIISTVLAGAMLSLFYLVTGNIKDSAANTRLLRIQTVAGDQIRRIVRRAYGPMLTTDAGSISTIVDPNPHPGLQEVWLYEDPDAEIGAYKISGDNLLERVNGVYTPMRIGSDTVWLDGPNSSFTVLPNRLGVAFFFGVGVQKKRV
jgi:type II secretory pathway pseudopilin PulG